MQPSIFTPVRDTFKVSFTGRKKEKGRNFREPDLCINSSADNHFLDGDSLPKANANLNGTFTSEKSLPTLIPHSLAFKIQAQQSLNGC